MKKLSTLLDLFATWATSGQYSSAYELETAGEDLRMRQEVHPLPTRQPTLAAPAAPKAQQPRKRQRYG